MHKTIASLAVAGVLMWGSIALSQSTRPATQPSAGAPVNKFCAVVPGDPVDPTVFIMHDGKKIGFCCGDCIGEFRKDPAKYLKDMK